MGVLRGPRRGAQRTPVGGDGQAAEDGGGVPSDVGLLADDAGSVVFEDSAALETSEDKLSWAARDCGESGRVEVCAGGRIASGDAFAAGLFIGGVFEALLLLLLLPRARALRGEVEAAEVAYWSDDRLAAFSARDEGAHWRARPSRSVTGGPFNLRRRLDLRHRSCIH